MKREYPKYKLVGTFEENAKTILADAINAIANDIDGGNRPLLKWKTKEEAEMEFKEGDKVDWNGAIGEVKVLDGIFISVQFECNPGIYFLFRNDGRFYEIQTEPCLKLVKSKVKKYQVLARNKLTREIDIVRRYFKSREDFESKCYDEFLQLLESTMIEVEE